MRCRRRCEAKRLARGNPLSLDGLLFISPVLEDGPSTYEQADAAHDKKDEGWPFSSRTDGL
jgi:hypothetical protein